MTITQKHQSFVKSLHLKKYRNELGLFIAEGPKIADEIISSDLNLERIYATDEWLSKFRHHRGNINCDIIPVSNRELEKISAMKTANQVLLVVKTPATDFDITKLNGPLILALDKLSDPGNFGTIVRIADWFGISSIVCSPGTVEMYSPKVVQASMGSIARVKLLSHDIKDFLKNFRDHYPISQVFATDLHGKNIYDMLDGSISFPSIIIMGSESHGISSEYEEFIDDRITIPSPSRSGQKAESLNVSVATGIVCALFFDRLRERSSAN